MLLRGKRFWVAAKIDDAGGPAQQAKIQKILPLVKKKWKISTHKILAFEIIGYISYEIKKVRFSQLLIFEKNGLVWPADIWPAHNFKY